MITAGACFNIASTMPAAYTTTMNGTAVGARNMQGARTRRLPVRQVPQACHGGAEPEVHRVGGSAIHLLCPGQGDPVRHYTTRAIVGHKGDVARQQDFRFGPSWLKGAEKGIPAGAQSRQHERGRSLVWYWDGRLRLRWYVGVPSLCARVTLPPNRVLRRIATLLRLCMRQDGQHGLRHRPHCSTAPTPLMPLHALAQAVLRCALQSSCRRIR